MNRESAILLHAAQRGFSIVTAIFLIVVLAALGAFIISVTGVQQASQALDIQGVRAYQAARAGIEWGAYQVLDPGHAGLNALGTCADTPPIPMPNCPASPTHLTGLAESLSSFTVTVQCTVSAGWDTTEGNRNVRVFEIVATACNQPAAGSCLGTTPATGYVERRLTATLSKCRDSTASLPRCSCG